MLILKTNFKNCYGIKDLEHTFNFEASSTYAIYSPNGTMKTSFANTFQDFSKPKDTVDLAFPHRNTTREILNQDDVELDKAEVFVIKPYDEAFKSQKISTLLVNSSLREKYEKIYEKIEAQKLALIKGLKNYTGFTKEIDYKFSEDFTGYQDEFFKAFSRVKTEVLDDSPIEFSDILYNEVFNEKTLKFLKTKDFRIKLQAYIEKYNELISDSKYFKKGVFNHNNANVIAKNLTDNGFFEANHFISLSSSKGEEEIKNQADLEAIITLEKNNILNDPILVKAFEEIDKPLKANQDLRRFRDYLLINLKILPELVNLDGFKQKLWISYLKELTPLFKDLDNEFEIGKAELADIVKQAKNERTDWFDVIDIFNERFSVPFDLKIKNLDDVILKEDAPSIVFEFYDESERSELQEEELVKILSNGEKRALYILNIIFEVEARKKAEQETLFIVDDIADSFDYKNKYAIVEYLQEISTNPLFKQIILSHNYDFFRTISGRLDMSRENKLHTIKTDQKIVLEKELYQKNPFTHWKKNFSNSEMLIASIPFVRNIAEFTGNDVSFNNLTSLLHIKNNTKEIKLSDLEVIYKGILQQQEGLDFSLNTPQKPVFDLIKSVSLNICNDQSDSLRLENKVALAIGIRLLAEEFMISKINDPAFVSQITSNQTFKLYERYKSIFPKETSNIEILSQVNLMTPENIHLNSFMYEPILDMAAIHLKNLYLKLSSLS